MSDMARFIGCKVVVSDAKAQRCKAICLECGSEFDAGFYSIDYATGQLTISQPIEEGTVIATHHSDCAAGRILQRALEAPHDRP